MFLRSLGWGMAQYAIAYAVFLLLMLGVIPLI
jgi:hypothetical protein